MTLTLQDTVLGGVTLPAPTESTPSEITNAYNARTLDHTLVTSSFGAAKNTWDITWGVISQPEFDIIKARYDVLGDQTFSPPETVGTYTVRTIKGTLVMGIVPVGDGLAKRSIGFRTEEV